MAYKRNRFGSIITESGETITKKMQEEYKRQVRNANYQRNKLINTYYNNVKNAPTMVNISKEVYAKQLQDKGFIPVKLSTSLKDIKNRKEFKEELKDTRQLATKKYHTDKLDKARDKMIEQLEENYNSLGKPLVDVVKGLSDTEFIQLYTTAKDSLLKALYYKEDDLEGAVEKLLSEMEIAVHNFTPKKERSQRMIDLGFWHKDSKGKIIRGR